MTTINLQSVLADVLGILDEFTLDLEFSSKISLIFGEEKAALISPNSLTLALQSLPEIEILTSNELKGALGAFSSQTQTIYLSESILTNQNLIIQTLLEEIGHYLDNYYGGNDSVGDEGTIFARLVQGETINIEELEILQAENDHGEITVNGVNIAVEMANFQGDVEDDSITGTSADDLIEGLGGDDTLNGLGGRDTINGGEGNDLIINTFGTADGGNDEDTLIVDYTNQTGLTSGIQNTSSSSQIRRISDSARLLYYYNFEKLNITGTPFNDSFISRVANETLNGGAGDDTIVGQTGDSLDGGEGTDTVTLDLSNITDDLTLTFDLASTTTNSLQGLTGTEVKNFENFVSLTLGSGNDSLTLLNNAVINGGTVYGDHGNDTLIIDYTNQTGLTSGIQNTRSSSQIRRRSDSAIHLYYYNFEKLNITGTPFNDSFISQVVNETLNGGAGDDTIVGQTGDSLDGGEGTDKVTLDLSNVTDDLTLTFDVSPTTTNNLQGLSGTEVKNFENFVTLTLGDGNDTLTLLNNALINGGTVYGDSGTDTLIIDYTNQTGLTSGIQNTSSSSQIRRRSDSAIHLYYYNFEKLNITGTPFNDSFISRVANETLNGGAGDDTIVGQTGDSLDGGEGTDTVSLDLSNVTDDLTLTFDISPTTTNNLQGITNTQVTNFEAVKDLKTGSGDDLINLANNATLVTGATIDGNAGNDILTVDFTNTTHPNIGVNDLGIFNTSLADRIETRQGGTDLLYYYDVEQFNITGTKFNDQFRVTSGNQFNAGDGNDTLILDLSNTSTNWLLDWSNSESQLSGDTNTQISNFEIISSVNTGSGNDTFNLSGNVLVTGATIDGNAGNDILTVDFTNTTHPNIGVHDLGIFNTSLADRIETRQGGTDLLYYYDVEQFNITGTQFDDHLRGFANDDTLVGGEGNDSLNGQDGNDQISGVDATNTNPGLNEIDTLSGGNGNDRFILGDAANTYYDDKDTTTDGTLDYANITDFNPDEDTIQLHGSKSNYILSNTTINDVLGTGIYVNKPNTEPNELIAFLAGVTDLDINSNSFTIAQDEITFSDTQFRILEDGTPVIPVTLIRKGAVQSETTVTINLNNGTATTPTDFNNTPITVNFSAGETSKTVNIPIIDDSEFELEEDILLTLSNPTNGTILGLQNTASLTIVDNEIPNPGIISFNRADYSINENGNPIVTVTLNRIEGSDGNVSITLNLTDGTATANEDYNNSPIIVNFANKETTKTVTIPIIDDTIFETNETINLTLSNPTNDATIGEQNTAILTIVEDDEPGVLSFSRSNFSVNEDGTNVITVRINRTNGTDGEVAVTLNLDDGTANATEDYDNTPITVNFGHGESRKFINIPLNNDSIYELDETINLSLSNPTNGAILGTQTTATLTIIDDDANPGTLEFSDSNFTINEDGTTTQEVTVIRTNGSDGDVSATISLNPGTATPNTDYNNNSIRVDFTNGETSKTVTIPIVDDPELEADETINLTLNNPSNGAIIGTENTATLTIIDDDIPRPGVVNFNRSQYSVNEDGTPIHTITLLRTNGDDGEITVTVNLTDGTATASEDYDNSSILVTFADQETNKTITVPIINDSEYEPTENLTLSLSNAINGATVGTNNTATLNIINDDEGIPGTFAFSQSNFSVNEDGNPVTAVTIIRTEGSDGNVSATINLIEGTATNPEDYTTNAITVNFLDGETSKVVNIPLVNDSQYELDETLNLTLNSVSNDATIGTQNTATLTIINDDPIQPGTVNFNRSQYSINEDGTPVSVITLLRTGGNDGEITVTVNLTDGTATASEDYNNTPILVTFADGESNKTITIPIVNDTQYEDTETINLSLTNATNGAAIGSNNTATVRILDNDAVPGIIEFNNTEYTVNEDGTLVAAITLIRTGGRDGNVSVRVTPSNGTAIAGDDYIKNNSITVNFEDGEINKIVNIPLINDVAVEENETINLTLSNPIGGATIGSQNTANLTIIDDDFKAALTLDIAKNSVNENEGTVTATITRNTPTDTELQVSLVSSDNSELVTPQTVTIPVGETSVTVTLTVVDDSLIDTTQTVQLIATAPEFISASDDISILNNDTVNLTLNFAETAIGEKGGITTATLTRDGVIDQPLTVQLTGDNGIIRPDTITIPANQTSATFEVEAINNTEVNGDQIINIAATPLYEGTNIAIADKTVTATIHIIDDESPSLTVKSDRTLISETGSATLTITRNTDTSEALTVNLTSSDTSEATIPNTVTIAAGETTTTAIVTAVSDGVNDGSQPVTITAIASGLNGSQTTLEVSDIEVPDLVITELGVNSLEYSDQTSQFSYKVANLGLQNLSGTWTDRVYLSTDNKLDENDELLTEFDITANIQVGQFYERNVSYFNPRLPGQYYLIATTDAEIVDENGQLTDQVNEGTGLGERNNTTITPFTVLPAYSAEVSTDVNVAVTGESIFFEGTARSNQDNSPIPFEFVTIEVENDGFTRKFNSFTDIDGNFTYNFTPLQGEAGDYNIRAYFPDNVGEDVGYEDSFSVLGATFNTSNVNHDIIADTPFTASVTLENLTDTALTGFTYDVSSLPNHWDVTVDLPADLAGNGSNTISYTITAPNDSVITQDTFNINLTSAEGVTASLPVFVDLERQVPRLVADTETVTRGMLRGEQTFVEIELSNEGGATANDIQVLLPDAPWLSLATADTIESLAPGESTNVTLALTPGNDLPLTEYQGNLFFDAVGNDGDLAVDFNFRAVSEATGDLAVNVIDEYFYFAEGSPKLSDATVILRDYFTQVEIARMTTDETGMVNFDDLPEGYYSLEVKAEDHDGFSQTVEINAGETETINPFLSFQTVEYNFGVEEIEGGIEDRYNITVNSTFRTDVPVPVVTIDPPLIDLESLTSIGQTLTIELTIENHGLIAAQDIELLFGEHPFYEIKPLIDSFDTLDAKSSLKIPVTITKIGEPEASPFNIASLSTLTETQEVPCVILSSICWGYPCGPENVKKRTLFIFENAECTIPKLPTGNNSLDFLRNFYAALRAASIYYGGSGSGGGGGGGNDDDGNNNSGNGNKPQINSLTPSLPFIELFCDVLKLVPCLKLRRGRGNGPQALLGLLKPLLEGDIPGFLEKTLGMFGLENPGIPVIDPQNPPDIFGLICDRASKKSPLIGTLCDVKDCIEGLLDVLSDRLGLSNISNNSLLANSAIIQLSNTSEIELLIQARDSIQTILDSLTGFFGSDVWLEVNDGEQLENWLINFAQKINTSSNSGSNISEQERQELLNISFPTTLTGTDINRFIDRWNRTLEYWNSGIFTLEDVPDGQSTDFINQSELLSPLQELQVISETSESEGFTDISDYINALVLEAETGLGIDDNSGVCAEVRIAINQEAVMTRSAFLGSLEIDNGSDLNLENISVVLDIRDENGNIVNDFFGITDPILDNITNLDGTGILTSDDPNTSINEGLGSAEWTFIPTNLAAPQEPTVYSIGGILSYTENGQVINVPLLSTPITVNPQAELTLDYFQQRNVFGDDPFTDATEVAEPFSLAVLVKNNGFGDARNLSITSAQPEIIENEKGLFAKFNIIGSQVNGEPASPSLSVDFEDIAAGETAVAEWLLKSSIQGKFNEYEVTFKHINDLGDEELSLIKEVNIHELIQTVQADDDGLSDFLVNDQFDANFYPDTLYFSNGTTASVTAIDDVTIDAPVTIFDLEAEITIFPPSEGGLGGIWTYIILDDPADGQFKIDKIVRNDGTEINPENIWRTDRTFPATGRPTYENKLHFLDFDATATYTIIYDSNENAAPKVREILDVDPNPRDIPVESLTVVFTEAIRVNTFDYQDITLTLDNDNNLITDAVTISRIDPITFRINNLTEITGNIGQYKLSIDATGVQDLAGNIGAGNITETWLFTGDRPTVESVNGFTNNLLTTPVESFTVTFTEIIQANSFTYEDITLTRNEGGNLVNDSIIITQISDRTYQVSNLTQFTNLEGDYELLVIANNIQDLDNNNGLGGKGFTWVLDNTAPILIDIDNLNSPRNTAIASIEVTLDQAIDPETFDYQDITLTLDGSNNLITSDVEIEKRNETTYRIKGLTFLQETEGEYTLTVNGDGIEDNAGNATINDLATTWILDQSQPFSATNIQVTTTPPVNELTPASAAIATINQYGQYRVNSRNITISGELPEENLRVYFKDATTGENLAQASVTGTTFTGDIELSGVGSRTVQLTIQDEAGNSSTGDIDIFADVTEPVLLNFLNIPTTLTVNSVNSIDVQFSEPLDLSTFDRDDLTLLRDGVIVPLPETVTINLVSDNIYRINGLEDVTNTPGNYTIQVDTTTLADNAGNPGSDVQTATFTIEAVSFEPTLDIDDNGVLELQDYNLIDLYASGLDATEFDFLINNFSNDLIGNDANRRDANSILSYFNEVGETLLDIDGNNQIEQQDYNLIDLFASQLDDLEFGFLIDNFTNDLIAENASRNNADLILTYFDTIVPETV